MREHAEEIVGQGQHAARGHIPFTPRARRVFDLSLHEALQLGHNYLGAEHILLALVREGDNGGVAAQVLSLFGADGNIVRQQVIALLSRTCSRARPTRRQHARVGRSTPRKEPDPARAST